MLMKTVILRDGILHFLIITIEVSEEVYKVGQTALAIIVCGFGIVQ
jgi:hypothetical protein